MCIVWCCFYLLHVYAHACVRIHIWLFFSNVSVRANVGQIQPSSSSTAMLIHMCALYIQTLINLVPITQPWAPNVQTTHQDVHQQLPSMGLTIVSIRFTTLKFAWSSYRTAAYDVSNHYCRECKIRELTWHLIVQRSNKLWLCHVLALCVYCLAMFLIVTCLCWCMCACTYMAIV